MKRILNIKNIFNTALIILFLVLLFVPSAKAMLLKGLIKAGFFSPDTSEASAGRLPVSDLSGIQFKDINGKIVDLGDLKGKIIFLNFWATWCPPCLAEMPAVNKLYEKFGNDNDVVFILADADGNLVKSQKFMNRKKFGLPVYAIASEMPEILFQGSLPTTVVFDKQGRIAYHEAGAANYGSPKFIAFINRLKTTN
ncbi:TlpA family protein disulfide reductase [Pedobacter hartonius]|uniref:Thiol-disulfide isomerase or thioredoxin n=1 Tax=Pedobacter hartonius TaxID=425514 RepID=A0A1H4F8H8_9SPHI|nr:TlpA disulfide reductase family protein [Pedobacter hartonius]SEA93207.1 Thiol-disulfide isomerase or thioredoxin [Pedobacter hartonius]